MINEHTPVYSHIPHEICFAYMYSNNMQQDIYEIVAEGVENAACVVCFLSQKYQDSVSAQACPHQNLTSRDASERLALIAGELQT